MKFGLINVILWELFLSNQIDSLSSFFTVCYMIARKKWDRWIEQKPYLSIDVQARTLLRINNLQILHVFSWATILQTAVFLMFLIWEKKAAWLGLRIKQHNLTNRWRKKIFQIIHFFHALSSGELLIHFFRSSL